MVAEGATARPRPTRRGCPIVTGRRGAVQEQLERVQDRVTDALTDASVPTSSRAAVAASGRARYLLIAAGDEPDEGHAAGYVAAAAPNRVETWTVTECAAHRGARVAPELNGPTGSSRS